MRAYASASSLPRTPQGSLPVWVGHPSPGRVSHPLDGKQSFMTSPHRHSPLTSLAWSHCAPTPGIAEAYRRLFGSWLPGSGEEIDDRPCMECYHNSPLDTAPADLLTDLCLPFRAGGEG